MTEAGEKWALEKAGGSFVFESQEAEFWIRAVCADVEKRADDCDLSGCAHVAMSGCLGVGFKSLKRELLGDG